MAAMIPARQTRIIATLGPASSTPQVLTRMIAAGMDCARLNFSHGSYPEHQARLDMIRAVARRRDKTLAILLDLQGPKIRVGRMKDGVPLILKTGETLHITTRATLGVPGLVSTTYTRLPGDVKRGDRILLDDGLIELRVTDKNSRGVTTRVVTPGVLRDNKGMNLPGVRVTAPSLSEKDRADVAFAVRAGVDYIALSFVRRAEDLTDLRRLLARLGAPTLPIIAKIEKPEAVEHLAAILTESDGVMVARGDLGVELRPEQVPAVQKTIIRDAGRAGVPVITATQMLESMIENSRPTRAEASDVANAVLDGTDAVMLSGETAVGRHPVEAVRVMAAIVREVENSSIYAQSADIPVLKQASATHAIVHSACYVAREAGAKAIVIYTETGSSARLLSKMKPPVPILAIAHSAAIERRMALYRGVIPLDARFVADTDAMVKNGDRIILQKKQLKRGDLVLVVSGSMRTVGGTNMMKLHIVGSRRR